MTAATTLAFDRRPRSAGHWPVNPRSASQVELVRCLLRVWRDMTRREFMAQAGSAEMRPIPVEDTVEVVAGGEADMVVVASRIVGVPGVEFVDPIPAEVQTMSRGALWPAWL